MRLSEIRGERVFDVIADIIEPVSNIASDDIASSFFKRAIRPADESVSDFAMKRIKEALPTLLRTHKSDLIKIMSAIEGVPEKEFAANLTMAGLIKSLYEMVTDEDLIAFLSS